ncbi:MAG: ABC transporter ATP-binding protein [Burkholderiaceae bacterium]|jgi:branched-chain amino acid transport system ATP-binding protein
MSSPILEVEEVSQQFGAFKALNRVSVAFLAGELAAIIGPNGAGKSTFFDVVSGARVPTHGQIRFNGLDLTGHPQHEFARRGIAKSFQITNIFQELSTHENVRVAAQMHEARYELFKPRASFKKAIEVADALLLRVGLVSARSKRAKELAHGQQRSLEVAMALACDPQLLLMDEPTAGMSPEETASMMNLITGLALERTVILVEHKMKLVMGICKRLVVLHHGELLAEGTPEAIRSNAEVRRVYLGGH